MLVGRLLGEWGVGAANLTLINKGRSLAVKLQIKKPYEAIVFVYEDRKKQ